MNSESPAAQRRAADHAVLLNAVAVCGFVAAIVVTDASTTGFLVALTGLALTTGLTTWQLAKLRRKGCRRAEAEKP